jgi:hypothetical protein
MLVSIQQMLHNQQLNAIVCFSTGAVFGRQAAHVPMGGCDPNNPDNPKNPKTLLRR